MAVPTGSYWPYPLAELQRARFNFRLRWNGAAQHDAVIRGISEQHHQFPPGIRVINWVEYPFSSEDTIYQMPHPPDCPVAGPSNRKRPYPKGSDLQQHCAKLTEAVCLSQPDPTARGISDRPFTFICDNCPASCQNQSDALSHLETEQHTSCSRYGFCSSQTELDVEDQQTLVLCEPRALYNSHVASLAWLSDKTAVVCPTCFLIFPDKLMCAYHHQSQHSQLTPEYAIGTVLAVRQLTLTDSLQCERCERPFLTPSDYADHWSTSESTGCPCPFDPVTVDPGQPSATVIIQVYCHLCRARLERSWEPKSGDITKSIQSSRQKRPRTTTYDENVGTDSHPSAWFSGFARFCLNHACLHFNNAHSLHFTARLHIRLIRLPKGSTCLLPPYLRTSDSDLLLMSIHECKRLLTHLERLKGLKKQLFKRTKHKLSELLQEAKLMEFP